MERLIKLMGDRLKLLEKSLTLAQWDTSTYPDGRLRVADGKRQRRFYKVLSSADKIGEYIPKADIANAKALAQKGYNKQFIKAAKHEKDVLETCMAGLAKCNANTAFEMLPQFRKELVKPYILSDELYAQAWQKKRCKTHTYREEDKKYATRRGEMVRSKSEAIIADILFEFGIPYFYEKELRLSNGLVKYPDFTLLNIRTRKEFYLEHMGRLDDEGYRKDNLRKLNEYQRNGIHTGKNLILTHEDFDNPLDIEGIRKMLWDTFCAEPY